MRSKTASQTPGIDPKHGLMRTVFFFAAWFCSEEGCDLTEGGLSGHWLPPPLYFCPRHRGAAQEVGHKNLRLTRDCLCLLELLLWVLINEWWMMRKMVANVCLTIILDQKSTKRWIRVLVKKCLQIRPETKSSIFLLHLDSSFPRALAAGTCPPNY